MKVQKNYIDKEEEEEEKTIIFGEMREQAMGLRRKLLSDFVTFIKCLSEIGPNKK